MGNWAGIRYIIMLTFIFLLNPTAVPHSKLHCMFCLTSFFFFTGDRGFRLEDDFSVNCGAHLILPAFTKGKSQLSGKEVEETRTIANVRIHIERVIGLLKKRFTILKGILPLRSVQSGLSEARGDQNASCDRLVVVCASLINLGGGIVTTKRQ